MLNDTIYLYLFLSHFEGLLALAEVYKVSG